MLAFVALYEPLASTCKFRLFSTCLQSKLCKHFEMPIFIVNINTHKNMIRRTSAQSQVFIDLLASVCLKNSYPIRPTTIRFNIICRLRTIDFMHETSSVLLLQQLMLHLPQHCLPQQQFISHMNTYSRKTMKNSKNVQKSFGSSDVNFWISYERSNNNKHSIIVCIIFDACLLDSFCMFCITTLSIRWWLLRSVILDMLVEMRQIKKFNVSINWFIAWITFNFVRWFLSMRISDSIRTEVQMWKKYAPFTYQMPVDYPLRNPNKNLKQKIQQTEYLNLSEKKNQYSEFSGSNVFYFVGIFNILVKTW